MTSSGASRRVAVVGLCLLVAGGGQDVGDARELGPVSDRGQRPGDVRWWKGNLHTHSFWSDGDDFPEMIVRWYRDHGYDFLALSDHNVLAVGERWIPADQRSGRVAYDAYLATFGDEWVETREDTAGGLEVRLKTLAEYRTLFEEPGRFLLIQAEEITDGFGGKPIHVNATNLVELIPPQGGRSVREVMQNNVDAVLRQRERTRRPMFPHLNHPNFGWAVTAEDLIALEGERFFEVYNGHPAVHNEGDSLRPSTERMWDIVLAERLSAQRDVLYGVAVDDAHNYHDRGPTRANAGRGWVMVRASALTPAALITAMEGGDFYATTGVRLDDVRQDGEGIALVIGAEPGVTYRTQFIGTRRDYAPPTPLADPDDSASVAYLYGDDIGVTFAEVAGTRPAYAFRGDELYVRATVISSQPKENPYRPGEVEQAWAQPVVPGR